MPLMRAATGVQRCSSRAAVGLAFLSLLVGCGRDAAEVAPTTSADEATAPTAPSVDSAAVRTAIDRGVSFVVPTLASIDAASLSMFDYLYRNWGISELSVARPLALSRIASGDSGDDELHLARLVDPKSPPPEDLRSAERTTLLLAAALHCDRSPPTRSTLTDLRELASAGGYDTTHAALAVGWMAELGCDAPDDVRSRVLSSMAGELASVDRRELVSDLAVEQSALLVYLGAPELLPAGWNELVLGAQRPDGGWGEDGRPSNWHTTLLALWTLAGTTLSATGEPIVIAASGG